MARPKKEVKEAIKEPEVIADGVVRDAGKENPLEDNPMERKPRIAGAWKKVTREELVALEASGQLLGYDPVNCEALTK
jgi:hypothetical protein